MSVIAQRYCAEGLWHNIVMSVIAQRYCAEGLWHNIDDALVLTAHVEQCNVQYCYQVLLIHSMTAAE
jgi:hypothetical protein